MALVCLNHLESRIFSSEIGWFLSEKPVRSSAPFVSGALGQSGEGKDLGVGLVMIDFFFRVLENT